MTEQTSPTDPLAEWFSVSALSRIIGVGDTETERAAIAWVGSDGKRWRPLLTYKVFQSLGGTDTQAIIPAAVAVECFHKASLIHDDIEDNDDERYGLPTVHARYGIPFAINVGDWLIGAGYRLLTAAPFHPEVRAELVRIAADGHSRLSQGQGWELEYCRTPAPLTLDLAIRLYELKTASAFEVAVQIGAAAAGATEEIRSRLSVLSRFFGITYQLMDDRDDFSPHPGRTGDLQSIRPTAYLAAACASSDPAIKAAVDELWINNDRQLPLQRLGELIARSDIPTQINRMCDDYRGQIMRLIAEIPAVPLRELLESLSQTIFNNR
ncbi:MAG: polyprenyl synthetase family protein [Kiritimatiellae bacterium]|nr:polyprenyl synthetase family protein [Kiritimatiellia bacterium]